MKKNRPLPAIVPAPNRVLAGALWVLIVACSYSEPAGGPLEPPLPGAGGKVGQGSAGSGQAGLPQAGMPQAASGAGSVAGAAAGGSGASGSPNAAGSAGAAGAPGVAGMGGTTGGGGNGEGGEGGATEPGVGGVLRQALLHRYDFEGTGAAVMDRKGTAHGEVVGGSTLSSQEGKGVVVLAGGTTGSYVNLPNGLVSKLTNVTLEAWLTWSGGAEWQRIFDFGDTTAASPEDMPASGKSYLFLTPATDEASGGMPRGAFSLEGGAATAETRVDATAALPAARAHVALVVDAAADELRVYVDGEPAGSQVFTGALSDINDVNCWLGRSQFSTDPKLAGTFHEFRVYGAALTDAQLAFSAAAGPDAAFLMD